MLQQIHFVKTVQLPFNSRKIVNFGKNLEFTLVRYDYSHDILFIKGDFEITKITESYDDGQRNVLKYDKSSAQFIATNRPETRTLTFDITANIELKENLIAKEICVVTYQLQIPSVRLQLLEIYQFFKDEFVLPGYEHLKFIYYVKKIGESTDNDDIEIQIKNPYDVNIQGKDGDYMYQLHSSLGVDLPLSFCFYQAKNVSEDKDDEHGQTTTEMLESTNSSAFVESRPEYVVPSQILSNATTLLHKLNTNLRYPDVYFVTSEGEKTPSHRIILAEFSDIFVKIFDETSEIPVQITVEDFSAETIQSALNFLYDKNDAINGKEIEVFKFAVKFGIQSLIDFCCSFFEEFVSPSNVCEFIQIAYLHNFEKLKQKCLKILVEKKKEIDSAKLAELPKNIFIDIYYFTL